MGRMNAESLAAMLSGIGVAEGCYHLAVAERAVAPHGPDWSSVTESGPEAAARRAGGCSLALAGRRPIARPWDGYPMALADQ